MSKKLFDVVIGNPPYQGTNHQQIYTDFYATSVKIANCVELIFPTGWQEPKNANNLAKLNKKEIKEDKQIVFIDNKHNAFPGVSGAEWTNIILWKSGYDNGLNGNQKIRTNGKYEKISRLAWDKTNLVKPKEITDLKNIVMQNEGFVSLQTITSVLKPYGLRTDVITNKNGELGTVKYGLQPLQTSKEREDDLRIYCKSGILRYVPKKYNLPRTTEAIEKYKVFIPYAWGNMSEKTGLGGAFSDIIIGFPNDICTETYLESGCFNSLDKAKKHAKYLLTKFARALLYANKYSQHSTTAWGAVPVQDYSEKWWNESIEKINEYLFEKYSVPKNIIDFVNNNIQTKNETNIINFNGDDLDGKD